ncbi:hypothetical protein GCM10007231_22260 [Nocardioides daphniae]|uniref:Uncharacterized protein n=1 Tax=Nocardioides daphniae TaxID=402297 RepID=A0ABQ1QDK9_9ACTN|nr:hypothetical protein GCM10007231_22260 [Nocardioides daphniae]
MVVAPAGCPRRTTPDVRRTLPAAVGASASPVRVVTLVARVPMPVLALDPSECKRLVRGDGAAPEWGDAVDESCVGDERAQAGIFMSLMPLLSEPKAERKIVSSSEPLAAQKK